MDYKKLQVFVHDVADVFVKLLINSVTLYLVLTFIDKYTWVCYCGKQSLSIGVDIEI